MTADGATITPLLVDYPGLKKLGIPFSRQWLVEMEAAGTFPRRLSLGSRKTQWLMAEITDFITKRAAERDESAEGRRRKVRGAPEPHGVAA